MRQKYVVQLSAEERSYLQGLIAAGTAPARKLARARILLKSDQGPAGPGWIDERVAEAVETSQPTVARSASNTSRKGWKRRSIAGHRPASMGVSSMASRKPT